ncbi:MAG: DUF998 domain-containing protein [Pseudomonadales bacterium]
MARLREIVVDSAHPARLARFWAEVLDGFEIRPYDDAEMERLAHLGLDPDTDPSVAVDGPGLTLFFQRRDNPKHGRNRLHLDVDSLARELEVGRLVALGATVRETGATFSVLLDPEGNEFCVQDRNRRRRGAEDHVLLPAAASVAGLAAVLLALLVPVVGGWQYPGFSHSAQYISELGALGAPHGQLISVAGFLPIGVLVAAFVAFGWRALAVSPGSAVGCLLFLGVAAGYLVAAIAPCDAGCPAQGSARQALHNLGGLLEYLGGGAGLLLIGAALARRPALRQIGMTTILLGLFVLGVFYWMGSNPDGAFRGAWQRVTEAALFGWIAMVSIGRLRPDGNDWPDQSPEPSSE